ncbi:MAG: hypothetical protein ACK4NF_03290, partial [Planctomycetota bacterium]
LSDRWLTGRDEDIWGLKIHPEGGFYFLLASPPFAFYIYLTGMIGFTLFTVTHLFWAKKLINNFATMKNNPYYLFSFYSYIFITLTLPLYHYPYITASSYSYWYILGYLFSFYRPQLANNKLTKF